MHSIGMSACTDVHDVYTGRPIVVFSFVNHEGADLSKHLYGRTAPL